jgi:hypothetical protein
MKRKITITVLTLILLSLSAGVAFAQTELDLLPASNPGQPPYGMLMTGTAVLQPYFPKVWSIVLNIVPGFGLGSYLEGNTTAGHIQLTSSLVGATLGGILITYGMVGGQTEGGSLLGGMEVTIGWVLLGAGIGGGIVFGVIASILYQPSSSTYLGLCSVRRSIGEGVFWFTNGVGYRFAF